MLGAVRASVGGTSAPIVNSSQVLVAGTTIAITSGVESQVCPVSAASAITLTSNPQIATGSNGQQVKIINTGANAITFADANGIGLKGTLVLGNTEWAVFQNLGGFWQLGETSGSPVWTGFTFANSYANVGTPHQACEYTKFKNEVRLRGYCARTVTLTIGAFTITTLPTGFRPSSTRRYPLDNAGSSNNQCLDVTSAGLVQYQHTSGTAPATHYVSMETAKFMT